MRNLKRFIFFTAIVAFIAVFPSQAAEKTYVTANDVFDPYGIFSQDPVGSFTVGDVKCMGHPEFNSLPCPPGSPALQSEWLVVAQMISIDDPRVQGKEIFEANINTSADGETTGWGNWWLILPSDDGGMSHPGYWKGSYVESGHPVSVIENITEGKVEFHGHGSVEGLLLRLEFTTHSYFGGAAFTSAYSGYILDPHAPKK
jgi:hypothetical protein